MQVNSRQNSLNFGGFLIKNTHIINGKIKNKLTTYSHIQGKKGQFFQKFHDINTDTNDTAVWLINDAKRKGTQAQDDILGDLEKRTGNYLINLRNIKEKGLNFIVTQNKDNSLTNKAFSFDGVNDLMNEFFTVRLKEINSKTVKKNKMKFSTQIPNSNQEIRQEIVYVPDVKIGKIKSTLDIREKFEQFWEPKK